MVMLACLLAAVLVCAAARSASFIHLEIYDRADGGYQQQAHKQFLHHFLPYINVFLDSIYISCLPLPYPGSPFTPPIPRLTFYQFPPSQFALFHLPGFQVSIFQVSQHPLFFPSIHFPSFHYLHGIPKMPSATSYHHGAVGGPAHLAWSSRLVIASCDNLYLVGFPFPIKNCWPLIP